MSIKPLFPTVALTLLLTNHLTAVDTPAYVGIVGPADDVIEIGADAARIPFDLNLFPPHNSNPNLAGDYPFSNLDSDISAYQAADVEMIGLLSFAPFWSNRDTWAEHNYALSNPNNQWEYHWCPPDKISVWKDMCKKVMQENKGKIFHYEIWNEPDGHFFLPPGSRPQDKNQPGGRNINKVRELIREKYIPMCKAAKEAALDVDPTGKIKIHTIASHTDHLINDESWTDWCFQETLSDGTGILDFSDGIVMHIYPFPYQGAGCFDVQWENWINKLTGHFDDNNVNLPIWVTEFGYQKNPYENRYPDERGHEPAIVYSQHLRMLATEYEGKPMVQGLTKFRLEYTAPTATNFRDKGWGVLQNNNKLAGYHALELLYSILSNMKTYSVISDASVFSIGGSHQAGGGLPNMPNNRIHAIRVEHFDGTEYVLIGAWRAKYDPFVWYDRGGYNGPDPWQKFIFNPNNIDGIGNSSVHLTIPGSYAGWTVEEINSNGTVSSYSGVSTTSSQITFNNVNLSAPNDILSPTAAKLIQPRGKFFLLTKEPSGGQQNPFNGPHTIPSRIQAEDFDNGGQDVAYNDNNTSGGGNYRPGEGVDMNTTADQGGGYNVNTMKDDEWMEYTISSIESGTYSIRLRAATPNSGTRSITVQLGNTTLGTINVGNTGGWQTWQTFSKNNVSISGGSNQVLRLTTNKGNFNLNWIEFVKN
ncbi:MAG: carbohydrate-binding protein [Verrucomicrobiota bacterium]